MIRTRVGYAGGTTPDPTYYQLGDHTETVQIDYDPARISYQDLLNVFWESHQANAASRSRQYMSVVFYHDEEQRRLAVETRDREADRLGTSIFTEIVPFTDFYLAEDYHQKYYLRLRPELAGEYTAIYPSLAGFVASTAVARVNGYVGGNGMPSDLESEIDSLGLSAEGRQRLREIVDMSAGRWSFCPV